MENNIKSILTVTFEDPFWIAVYERTYFDSYEVCKITFGSEPKDYEVYDYMMNNWNNLCFTKPIKVMIQKHIILTPKDFSAKSIKESGSAVLEQRLSKP